MKLPSGESGVKKGNLTEDRREALAEYWGATEKERAERWGDPAAMGKLIGLSAATVRAARTDPRIKRMVKETFDNELLYLNIEARAIERKIMLDESQKGDTRLKAARTIEQMAGNLTNGPPIQIVNDNRSFDMADLSVDEILRELRSIRPEELQDE